MRRKTPAIADRRLDEHPFSRSQYWPLVPFQEPPPPASPVIPILTRRLEELAVEPLWAHSFYFPFPYFEQPPPAASPVIGYRYGRPIFEGEAPFILSRYGAYPFGQAEAAAATPVLPFLRGQWLGDTADVALSGGMVPQYLPFPFRVAAGAPSDRRIFVKLGHSLYMEL